MDHEPRNRAELKMRGKVGLYPVYKTREKIKVADFPTYTRVKV